MALLYWLATQSKCECSVEIGFGMGMSAAAIMAGRRGHHVTIDPWLANGRGEIPLKLLGRDRHTHYRRRSQDALPALFEKYGQTCDLIFIDGSHLFEGVFVDFILSDALCADGGYIVFDDADFPAVETVISYIYANRIDYNISELVADGLTIIQKNGADDRAWNHFAPFDVSERKDWARRPRRKRSLF